ncbi:MAG: 6-phosphogluconolactonase [Methylococcales bacterium]|nr:MAG: 6-phosphogluconolactonase [Methylococcales bacterium]
MQQTLQWHNFETSDLVANAVYQQILNSADKAIADHGQFKLVLAGGSTPEKVYHLLAKANADWSRWFIYYGDERCLAIDHAERNSLMAETVFLSKVAIPKEQIFTIPAELGPELAAQHYQLVVAKALPFDMVLLGMGEDGHTASLFPGHHHNTDELAHAVYNSPKPPPERVSISAKGLSDSAQVIFLITGKNKQEAVKSWRLGEDLPVADIIPKSAVDIYIDNDAFLTESA